MSDLEDFAYLDEDQRQVIFTHNPFTGKILKRNKVVVESDFRFPELMYIFSRTSELFEKVVRPQQALIKKLRDENKRLCKPTSQKRMAQAHMAVERKRLAMIKEEAELLDRWDGK